MRGIHRSPVNSPHKGSVTRKMYPFDDVIIIRYNWHDDVGKATDPTNSFEQWFSDINCSRFQLVVLLFRCSRPRIIASQISWWRDIELGYTAPLSLATTNHISSEMVSVALQWRHNGRAGVSNHQSHDCLLNRLFRRRSNKTSKLRVTGLCAGNSPVTGEFHATKGQ